MSSSTGGGLEQRRPRQRGLSSTAQKQAAVDGQVIGGIALGIGGALYEKLAYDATGQLLTATYMDYLIPTAAEIPPIVTAHLETPSPHNPLMEWSGRAPAPPAIEAGKGRQRQGARYVSEFKHRDRR